MPKQLWECPGCGEECRCDPVAGDDWGGEDVAIGPDCDDCDEIMEAVDEADEGSES